MVLKISFLLLALSFITKTNAQCYQTPATTLPPFNSVYHPCPRSMATWNYMLGGPAVSCSSGPSGNKCRGKECTNGKICCQDNNGCNQCVGNK